MSKVTQLLAAAAVLTLSATPVFAQTKGTIAEYDGRSAFTIKAADGKMVKGTISGSRTKVMIKGAAGSREALKAGMTCTVTGPADGEATEVACD
jgi:hypothetical protein